MGDVVRRGGRGLASGRGVALRCVGRGGGGAGLTKHCGLTSSHCMIHTAVPVMFVFYFDSFLDTTAQNL